MCVLKLICVYYQRFQLIICNWNGWAAIFFPCHPYIESTTILSDGTSVKLKARNIVIEEYEQDNLCIFAVMISTSSRDIVWMNNITTLLATMLEINSLGPCHTFCIMDLHVCVVTESSEWLITFYQSQYYLTILIPIVRSYVQLWVFSSLKFPITRYNTGRWFNIWLIDLHLYRSKRVDAKSLILCTKVWDLWVLNISHWHTSVFTKGSDKWLIIVYISIIWLTNIFLLSSNVKCKEMWFSFCCAQIIWSTYT